MTDRNFVDRLSVFIGEKASVVFLVSVVLTAYEVVMRYVFNAPTIWVHDSAIALSAVGFVLAGAYAHESGAHIRITSVYDICPPRLRRVFDFVGALVVVAYLVLLVYATARTAIPSVKLMETSAHAWDVPIPAFLKSMLVIGSVLLLAQAVSRFVHLVHGRD